MIETFFKLLIGHAVADFWAQSAEMRTSKSAIQNVLADGVRVWPYSLTAHALIHAGAVWVATSSAYLAMAEFVAHWCIDFMRSRKYCSVHVDQGAHIACKVLWSVLA